MEGRSAASTAAARWREKGMRLDEKRLAEALEQLPELHGAEILKSPQEVLVGRFHENPAGRAGGITGDKVDPATGRRARGLGLQVDPPRVFPARQVPQMTSAGMVRQIKG